MKAALLTSQLLGLLVIALVGSGCRPLAVNVEATGPICGKSVEVHLVGVNRYQIDRWDAVSMTKYWKPENELRKSAKDYTRVFSFGQGPCEISLSKKDPIRSTWKKRGAEYVYILADLPGTFDDKHGIADARRSRIPALNSKCWPFFENKININIESGDIVCLTPHKCE